MKSIKLACCCGGTMEVVDAYGQNAYMTEQAERFYEQHKECKAPPVNLHVMRQLAQIFRTDGKLPEPSGDGHRPPLQQTKEP